MVSFAIWSCSWVSTARQYARCRWRASISSTRKVRDGDRTQPHAFARAEQERGNRERHARQCLEPHARTQVDGKVDGAAGQDARRTEQHEQRGALKSKVEHDGCSHTAPERRRRHEAEAEPQRRPRRRPVIQLLEPANECPPGQRHSRHRAQRPPEPRTPLVREVRREADGQEQHRMHEDSRVGATGHLDHADTGQSGHAQRGPDGGRREGAVCVRGNGPGNDGLLPVAARTGARSFRIDGPRLPP